MEYGYLGFDMIGIAGIKTLRFGLRGEGLKQMAPTFKKSQEDKTRVGNNTMEGIIINRMETC